MTTTSKSERVKSVEFVKKVVSEITTTDTKLIIELPKSIFEIDIDYSKTFSFKNFLHIVYHVGWINYATLKDEIIKSINDFMKKEYIKACKNSCKGYINLHFDNNPYQELLLEENENNYSIIVKDINFETKIEYQSYDE